MNEVDPRVRGNEVETRGNEPVSEDEGGLDQSGQAGRLFRVPDVGLDGADGTERLGRCGQGEGLRQSLDLQGIADGGAGGMALDIPDGLGRDPGNPHGFRHRPGLSRHAGRTVTGLHAAVVVDRGPHDDRVHVIAVSQGAPQVLQDHRGDATAEDRALARGIEGSAVPVHRVDVALLGQVAADVGDAHGRRPGEDHVAVPGTQALACEVDCHQRRRAGGLHGDAGAGQVELVRYPRAEEVLVVAEVGEPGGLAGEAGRAALGHQIARHDASASGEHPDGAVVGVRMVAGVLEGLPGDLEEETVLRIDDRRLTRGVPEEGGVEAVHVAQDRRCLDVVGVRQQ